jgi:hypothetical protein
VKQHCTEELSAFPLHKRFFEFLRALGGFVVAFETSSQTTSLL